MQTDKKHTNSDRNFLQTDNILPATHPVNPKDKWQSPEALKFFLPNPVYFQIKEKTEKKLSAIKKKDKAKLTYPIDSIQRRMVNCKWMEEIGCR